MVRHGIQKLDPVVFQEDEDFGRLQISLRNALKGIKAERRGEGASDSALKHDAEILAQMAKLQLRGESDDWGPMYRLLSLDRALNPTLREAGDASYKRLYYADHPENVARIVLPVDAKEISTAEYEGYVVNAVQTSLGVVSELASYSDVYLVDKLERAGLPARTLLTAGVPIEALQEAYRILEKERVRLGPQFDQELAPINEELLLRIQAAIEETLAFKNEFVEELQEEIALRDDLIAIGSRESLEKEEELAKVREILGRKADEVEGERLRASAESAKAKRWRAMSFAILALLVACLVILLLNLN